VIVSIADEKAIHLGDGDPRFIPRGQFNGVVSAYFAFLIY